MKCGERDVCGSVKHGVVPEPCVTRIEELDTPSVAVDLDVLEANVCLGHGAVARR